MRRRGPRVGREPTRLESGPPPPPPLEQEADPLLGRVLGGCRVVRRLGQGGMGTVYLARHELLEKDVVVKVLRPELAAHPLRVRRFVQEARAAARLEDPHVVTVYDVGSLPEGVCYIVMEYLEGSDLYQLVRARGPLPPAEATRLILGLARALRAIHAAGLLHRDVKPENALVTGAGQVKLIDFGLAKDLSQGGGLTRVGARIGTPLYMAPEVGRLHNVDARADIYSLGLTWYFLLTGRPPFAGASFEEVLLGQARLAPPRQLPPPFRAALARMVAWDRRERFSSAAAVLEALEPLAAAEAPACAPPAIGALPPIPPTLASGEPGPAAAVTRRLARSPAPPLSEPGAAPRDRRSPDEPPGEERLVVLEPRERGPGWTWVRAFDTARGRLLDAHLLAGTEPVSAEARLRLERLRRVRHPRLAAHLELHEHAGRVALLSEPVNGRTLQAACGGHSRRQLHPRQAARVVADVALALSLAYEQGLSHGALGPTSVVIESDGRGRLVDLGLVALRGPDPGYDRAELDPWRAPERLAGEEASPAALVFALGGLLELALTGRAPLPGTPPARSDVGALLALARRCQDPDPQRRFREPSRLAAALEAWLGLPDGDREPRWPRWSPGQRLGAFLALALGCALALTVWAARLEARALALEAALERLEQVGAVPVPVAPR